MLNPNGIENMSMNVLHRFPTPDHGCQGVELYSNGPDLWAIFSYEAGNSLEFGLLSFERTLAFNHESEPVARMRDGTYDAVVQVDPSSSTWSTDLLERMPPIEDKANFHHFAAYFSNCGTLDVLAKRIVFDPRIERETRLATLLKKK